MRAAAAATLVTLVAGGQVLTIGELLPFARAATGAALRRISIGFAVIIAVSVVAWVGVPVSFPRALAATGDGLGAWVLTSLRGSDPPVNCLPSSHCTMAVHAALRLRGEARPLAWWSAPRSVAVTLPSPCGAHGAWPRSIHRSLLQLWPGSAPPPGAR